jgi:dihydroorotate dehydrogenase (fumarate)
MVDLSTDYLGLSLKNPLVVAASPLSQEIDNLREMEEAGAAAIVLHSLFEEQISLEHTTLSGDALPEELRHIPEMSSFRHGANSYLAHVYQAKKAVNIPVIASLNGYFRGEWIQFARLIEVAGADALELNLYYLSAKTQVTGSEIEKMYLDLVSDVRSRISIPIAVKLSPYFSAMANMASRLEDAGANGLVLFNRFYQPDIDIDSLQASPAIDLSSSAELRLRLRWVAILTHQLKIDLAVTGGVHTAEDVIKSMLAGAKVATMASALIRRGIPYMNEVLANLQSWLGASDFDSVAQIQGLMSQQNVANPSAFERANYLNVLSSGQTR